MDHNNIDYNKIKKIGNIIAIPFFLVAVYYFYNIKKKTIIKLVLFIFEIIELLFDMILNIIFI